eukprot:6492589-Amphidinium_carterae.3
MRRVGSVHPPEALLLDPLSSSSRISLLASLERFFAPSASVHCRESESHLQCLSLAGVAPLLRIGRLIAKDLPRCQVTLLKVLCFHVRLDPVDLQAPALPLPPNLLPERAVLQRLQLPPGPCVQRSAWHSAVSSAAGTVCCPRTPPKAAPCTVPSACNHVADQPQTLALGSELLPEPSTYTSSAAMRLLALALPVYQTSSSVGCHGCLAASSGRKVLGVQHRLALPLLSQSAVSAALPEFVMLSLWRLPAPGAKRRWFSLRSPVLSAKASSSHRSEDASLSMPAFARPLL